jgi:excinuclease ABC subunit C
LQSALDTIPGVGKKRKAALLQHFKSVKNIRAADPEKIGALPGFSRSVAESIQKALNA